MSFSNTLDRTGAISRYVEIADRLPSASPLGVTKKVNHLGDLVSEFDVFVLDGYGVLNVGTATVPGAVQRVAALQNAGKRVIVLTNGATISVEKSVKKYQSWGYQLQLEDVVSSRDALIKGLSIFDRNTKWGVAATVASEIESIASQTQLLEDDYKIYQQADAFILLSTAEWSDSRQELLHNALLENSRPVLVGNPELVAPQVNGMSLEPGYFAHALADANVCEPQFFGKPFRNAFEIVARRISGVAPHRIAMVGDTLHTDILGGAAFGWRTVLIKDHGLMKGSDENKLFLSTGIRPDFVAATT